MIPARRARAFGALAAALSLGYAPRAAAAQVDCDESPGPGYTQTISGLVDGDELRLTVSDRFGGAVESVTWRGKEFINIWDHGRQISYAWGMDDYGECYNPTEPGSARDYQNSTSTSDLLSVCKAAPNRLTTTTRLAYWLAPGETGFCNGVTTAVNDDLVSDQVLEKTIQIGYEGLENVILFDAVITNPTDHNSMQAEIPTGYLTDEFNTFWRFNPQTGELTTPESDPLVAPWSFNSFGRLPPILSTPDGSYAMGAYYGGPKPVYYEINSFDAPPIANTTNKWNAVIREQPYPAGTYHYRSFAIVGTLEQVQQAMAALYDLSPTDFSPPEGYVDVANCDEIAGWAWDPGLPDQPIEAALYDVGADGSETLIATFAADNYRVDLAEALGDNGQHGFTIPTPLEFQDGERHTIRAYGVNPDDRLPDSALLPTESMLRCPAAAQPTDAPTVEPSREPASPPAGTAPPTANEPSTPAGPGCLSGALIVALGAVVTQARRFRS